MKVDYFRYNEWTIELIKKNCSVVWFAYCEYRCNSERFVYIYLGSFRMMFERKPFAFEKRR